MSGATSPAGSGVLTALKQKMQNLRDELDKYKDMYEDKCRELDVERTRHDEVGLLFYFSYLKNNTRRQLVLVCTLLNLKC